MALIQLREAVSLMRAAWRRGKKQSPVPDVMCRGIKEMAVVVSLTESMK